jgi:hypothetical protein
VGKAMQKLKRDQKDNEIVEAAKLRQKDKDDEKVARERIKMLLEQDKAERKARLETAQGKKPEVTEFLPTGPIVQSVPTNCNSTKIQFRLPDGSTLTKEFEADSALIEAFNYLNSSTSLRKFTLSTSYPRRTFKDADYSSTFRQLELLPNAVLLVLISGSSSGRAVSIPQATGLSALYNQIVMAMMAVWGYIRIFLGLNVASSPPPSARPSQANQPPQAGPSNPRKRQLPRRDINRDGNVARLRNTDGDDDDDSNTWNGNSTQQM